VISDPTPPTVQAPGATPPAADVAPAAPAHSPESLPAAPHGLPTGTEYVGFLRRIGATLIDLMILGLVTMPPLYAVYGEEIFETDRLLLGRFDFFVTYLLPAVYAVAFWHYKQATPGKMAVSAIIVDARSGGPVPLVRLVGRYLAYFISAAPLGLGFLWIAIDRRKQGWHDKLVRTVVIEEPI
jgi:uncharacterized RDD family membrane protein YckC